MITYKAYKAYHKRNSLYIRKMEQLVADGNLSDGNVENVKLSIVKAKEWEANILKQYPNYI